MKKLISLILALVMLCSATTVFAEAAQEKVVTMAVTSPWLSMCLH